MGYDVDKCRMRWETLFIGLKIWNGGPLMRPGGGIGDAE